MSDTNENTNTHVANIEDESKTHPLTASNRMILVDEAISKSATSNESKELLRMFNVMFSTYADSSEENVSKKLDTFEKRFQVIADKSLENYTEKVNNGLNGLAHFLEGKREITAQEFNSRLELLSTEISSKAIDGMKEYSSEGNRQMLLQIKKRIVEPLKTHMEEGINLTNANLKTARMSIMAQAKDYLITHKVNMKEIMRLTQVNARKIDDTKSQVAHIGIRGFG